MRGGEQRASNVPCKECGEGDGPIAGISHRWVNDYATNQVSMPARTEVAYSKNNSDLIEAVHAA
jgi:hypothetical protein